MGQCLVIQRSMAGVPSCTGLLRGFICTSGKTEIRVSSRLIFIRANLSMKRMPLTVLESSLGHD